MTSEPPGEHDVWYQRPSRPLRIRRRTIIGGTVAAGLIVKASGLGSVTGASAAPNPVQAENTLPGTWGWELAASPATRAPSPALDVYLSAVSVRAGDTIDVKVSTSPAATYRVEIYRIGHYGGIGARRVACLPTCATSTTGSPQPIPAPDPVTGEVRLAWTTSHSIVVPTDWLSGLFAMNLVLTSGPHANKATYSPFIVLPAASRAKTALVIGASTTWQAYNNWGGKSLYDYNSPGGRASKVSFDRPYDLSNQNIYEWEAPVARWLESEGHDVVYASDLDFQLDPTLLSQYRTVVFDGHDEYWTAEMRTAIESARDAGTNLAFIGANIGYWQIRLENSNRTVVCYKDAALDPQTDPAKDTIRFHDLVPPRPEAALIGVQFMDGLPSGNRTYTVNPAALTDPWFAGTGFVNGATIAGIVGYEYDTPVAGLPAQPVTTFFTYGGSPAENLPPAASVRYVAPSGAIVWSTGAMDWGLHLSDSRVAAFTRNALLAMFNGTGAPNVPPSVSVTAPIAGASVAAGSPMTLTASASDDGSITGVEFFVDAVSVGSVAAAPYSMTWTASGSGSRAITARATDNLGAATTSTPVAITVTTPPPTGAVALVGAARGSNGGGSPSVVLTLPAGVQAGDVVFVGVQVSQSESGTMVPAGFTLVSDFRPTSSWHPRLVASRGVTTAGQTTVTVPTGYIGAAVAAAVYRGASTSAPIAAFTTASADGTSVTAASINAIAAGSRLVMLLGAQNHSSAASWTAPSGMTLLTDENANAWRSAAVVDQAIGAGATGTRAAVFAQQSAMSAVLLAVTPQATGGSNVPPSVSVTAPIAGASVAAGSPMTLTASASDDGSITGVEFFVDAVSVGSVAAAPYSMTWTASGSGSRAITARATDNLGAATTSTPVAITVTTPPPTGAVALVGAARGSNGGGSPSVVLTLPAGVQAGDVVFVGVQVSQSESGTMVPAGFTLVSDFRPTSSWHPRLVASRGVTTAGQTTVTVPTGYIGAAVAAAVYRGASTSAPIAAFTTASADGTSVTAASINAIAAGSRLVMLLGAQNHSSAASWTAPSGMTLLTDENANAWRSAAVVDQAIGAGATGTRAAVFAQQSAMSAVLLAVTPQATGGSNVPPSVSVTAPIAGASVAAGSPMTLTASASDDGSITGVEFFVDAVSVGSVAAAPYSMTWTASGSGSRAITARATDNLGAATTSTPVAITVTTPPPTGAVALVGAAQAGNSGSSSTITVALPAGIQANDQIVVGIEIPQSVSATITPTGYTLVTDYRPSTSSRPRTVVVRRTAVGGETTVVVPTGSVASAAVAAVYRGVSTSAPIAAFTTGSAQGTSVSASTITSPSANSMLVMFLAARNHTAAASWTAPTGMTKRADQNSASGRSAAVADQLVGSGSTGSRTATFSRTAALATVMLVLRKA